MRAWLAGGVLVLLSASAVAEDERFYPVVGPDGRIEMIRGEGRAPARDQPAAGREKPEPARPNAAAGASPAVAADAPRPLPHAAYDSDEYVDSEAMDAATAPALTGKRRFYTISDEMGARTTESPADPEAVAAPAPRPAAAPERWEPLVAGRRHWTGEEAAQAMPWLPRCLDAEWLRQQPVLGMANATGVVVDKQDYAFLDRNRVLSGWQLEAGGLRTLVLRSYSRKERDPAFLDPRLAFLDANGCVTRVEQGVFVRRYAATDQRHGYLWGEVLVHVDERWMLLLAPPGDEKSAGLPSWRSSRVGQLKFTLKK